MKLASFDAIVSALDRAGVRYLIADGLAVNAHGYLHFTRDVDLIVQLVPDNVKAAFSALAQLGYRPVVPVTSLPRRLRIRTRRSRASSPAAARW